VAATHGGDTFRTFPAETKKLTRDIRAVRDYGTVEHFLRERGVMANVTLTKREPTYIEIADRAFEIYVSRGGEHGHDVGDWFEAERQLKTELQTKKRPVRRTRP
jgi:Protein of unknown function (DUF2934)